MAEFEPTAAQDEAGDQIQAEMLVVGGGIAGMTAAIETAELGKKVMLVERSPSLGGRVAAANQYFPKLCPPTCGMEINLKRMRSNSNVRVLTLAEVEGVSGSAGDYEVQIRLNPRYVNEKCTCCGECEKVCEIEGDNDFNYGIDKRKAIYLPHFMAYPQRYVVDPEYADDSRMSKCVEACEYGAIELDMQPRTLTAKVGAIVWATGWKPYDPSRLGHLGYGSPNVITNTQMEEAVAAGKIVRPSDGKPARRIVFVQCAGSRDEEHLPYCSAVCCRVSLKQALLARELDPEAQAYILYKDIRAPGQYEDFYRRVQEDEGVFLTRARWPTCRRPPTDH